MDEIWAIEKKYLETYLSKIASIDITSIDSEAIIKAFNDMDADEDDLRDLLKIKENTAIITIEGVLKQTSSWLARWLDIKEATYPRIIKAINKADKNLTIKNIDLRINSPGGEVKGVDEIWQVIAKCDKKFRAINTGIMASAAYWIASPADEIVSTSPLNETGSIGVVVNVTDYSKLDNRIGIKEIKIRSSNAFRKNPDATTKQGKEVIQERIDAIERIFFKRISSGRNVSIEHIKTKFGEGGVFVAQDPDASKDDAISVEMIDGLIDPTTLENIPSQANTSTVGMIGVKCEMTSLPGRTGPPKSNNAKSSNVSLKNKTREEKIKIMDLKELMAQHPQIASEIEKLKAEAFTVGKAEGMAEIRAHIKKVVPYLQSDNYSASIKTIAVKILSGESNADIDTIVALADLDKEKASSDNAKDETSKQKDTPPGSTPPLSTSTTGVDETEADFKASEQRLKEKMGMT